jgi:hypothetical protein
MVRMLLVGALVAGVDTGVVGVRGCAKAEDANKHAISDRSQRMPSG